jgi:hypothetical protein
MARWKGIPWVIRSNIFHKLILIRSSELDVGPSTFIYILVIPIPINLISAHVLRRQEKLTWTFLNLTPDRLSFVARTAELTLKPSTTSIALVSSVGYPSVEISYRSAFGLWTLEIRFAHLICSGIVQRLLEAIGFTSTQLQDVPLSTSL